MVFAMVPCVCTVVEASPAKTWTSIAKLGLIFNVGYCYQETSKTMSKPFISSSLCFCTMWRTNKALSSVTSRFHLHRTATLHGDSSSWTDSYSVCFNFMTSLNLECCLQNQTTWLSFNESMKFIKAESSVFFKTFKYIKLHAVGLTFAHSCESPCLFIRLSCPTRCHWWQKKTSYWCFKRCPKQVNTCYLIEHPCWLYGLPVLCLTMERIQTIHWLLNV